MKLIYNNHSSSFAFYFNLRRYIQARAKQEDGELQRVLAETKATATSYLPRRRSESDDSAVCVLVTPPVKVGRCRLTQIDPTLVSALEVKILF
jgi:hypothetical protein